MPDKDEYLYIVEQLAKENDLNLDIDELHLLAERFALRRNGRSPRTARTVYQPAAGGAVWQVIENGEWRMISFFISAF